MVQQHNDLLPYKLVSRIKISGMSLDIQEIIHTRLPSYEKPGSNPQIR